MEFQFTYCHEATAGWGAIIDSIIAQLAAGWKMPNQRHLVDWLILEQLQHIRTRLQRRAIAGAFDQPFTYTMSEAVALLASYQCADFLSHEYKFALVEEFVQDVQPQLF